MFRRWQRIDRPGLELASIVIGEDDLTVSSMVIDGGDQPFSLSYFWTLTPQWVTRTLRIGKLNDTDNWLIIERTGDSSWRVNGTAASHLDGCDEIDVSATPFCNTLAIRRLGRDGALMAAYIDAGNLSVTPSRQRYERISDLDWRYHDLGVASGYSADLMLDDNLLVKNYEGLFEAL